MGENRFKHHAIHFEGTMSKTVWPHTPYGDIPNTRAGYVLSVETCTVTNTVNYGGK